MARCRPFARPWRWSIVAGCVLAWSSAFVVTHLPGGHLPPLPGGDKIAHGVGYAALTALTLLALRGMGVRRRRRLVFLLVAVPIYAGLDELTQILVNRHCCLGDWLADVIGAAIAVGFFELIGYLAYRARIEAQT